MEGLKKLFLLQGVVFVILAALTVAAFFSSGLNAMPKVL